MEKNFIVSGCSYIDGRKRPSLFLYEKRREEKKRKSLDPLFMRLANKSLGGGKKEKVKSDVSLVAPRFFFFFYPPLRYVPKTKNFDRQEKQFRRNKKKKKKRVRAFLSNEYKRNKLRNFVLALLSFFM